MLSTDTGLLLLLVTLGCFALAAYRAGAESKTREADVSHDEDYFSARASQSMNRIGMSLFASSMGVWLLFAPAEVAYYGGFFDVMGYAIALMAPLMMLAYLGPMIRKQVPDGVTLGDYVGMKMGRPMQVGMGVISVLFMLALLVAEFSAVGRAMELLTGMRADIAILLIAGITAAYTAFGGLRASIETDIWQGWVIIGLMAVVFISQLGDVGQLLTDAATYTPVDRFNDWEHGSIAQFTMPSFLGGLVLVITLSSVQLFNQGNWQRIHAAEDDEAITKGALIAAALTFPLMFTMGLLGTAIAGAHGPLDDASTTFFVLAESYSPLLLACLVVLGVSLVCSTTDSLLNATVATVSRDILQSRLPLQKARWASFLLILPVMLWAILYSGITAFDSALFLFVELLATAAVLPLFLTLVDEIHPEAAVTGLIGGLGCVFLYGFLVPIEGAAGPLYSVFPDRIATGLHYIIQPVSTSGEAHLNIFITALVGSVLLTYLASRMITYENRAPVEQE